jgi:hypothetical protein
VGWVWVRCGFVGLGGWADGWMDHTCVVRILSAFFIFYFSRITHLSMYMHTHPGRHPHAALGRVDHRRQRVRACV